MTQALLNSAELTASQFGVMSQLVKELSGINLHNGKMALVRARLNKRLRQLGLTSFGQYVEAVCSDASGLETATMLDALSTNLTAFFREPRHFELLKKTLVPALLAQNRHERRVRIWSAGCSSGEEPYSIAITLEEALAAHGWEADILATDLSWRMLRVAREAVYAPQRVRDISPPMLLEHFVRTERGYQVKDHLRRRVHLAHLNLMNPWPMKGLFDMIFCRNVMIYFDKTTQGRLIERFWNQMKSGGTLFLGHSESLAGINHRFRYVQPTVYVKP